MAEYQMMNDVSGSRQNRQGYHGVLVSQNWTGFEFRAGPHSDFAFVRPYMEMEGDYSGTFSIASSPGDKRSSHDWTAALGTKFIVSRPRGSFTVHEDITRPAVFLAGGIGIAPVRSILQCATQERLLHKLYLFSGFLQILRLSRQKMSVRSHPVARLLEASACHLARQI